MKEATVVYPHQLFHDSPAIKTGRPIYLVEEPLFLKEFPTHTQKLLLHRLSMQAYKQELEALGHQVTYLAIQDLADTASVFAIIAAAKVTHLHIVDTTDYWLEKRIVKAARSHRFQVTRYDSPLFILPRGEAMERYQKSKKHMAQFYKSLRQDKKILLEDTGEPTGGRWSFDEENRKKLPKNTTVPADMEIVTSPEVMEATEWLASFESERYGEALVWVPWTRKHAKEYLEVFLHDRLSNFGTYEDAIATEHVRLFHSTLSPLLNIGLLGPAEVLSAATHYGHTHNIALNNIEGFVRQILGWREFIRASYEVDGISMRTSNFWQHTHSLSQSFWEGTTGLAPLDISIKNALLYGYNHHIERLMVLGNFMLLAQTHPDEVYTWFMGMYVDAYDWVMVPNVYGMSQFADGGSFATKPYISGSNYLKKMSNYQTGDWEELWTALYWHFIATHKQFFISNHRLSMMPRLLEKMDPDKKQTFTEVATAYIQNLPHH